MGGLNEVAIGLVNLIVGRVLCFLLALLGTITNSINIAVFYRQGFRDSITISFFAISVLDLIRCVSNIPLRLDWFIEMVAPSFVLASFQNFFTWLFFVLSSPLSTLVAMVTAYMSLERCLAVCIPLKIKHLITPRVTSIVLIASSVLALLSHSLSFCALTPRSYFSAMYNETLLVISYDFCGMDRLSFMAVRFGMNNFWGISTFIVIVVCSAIIIVRMRASNDFRLEMSAHIPSATPGTPSMSARDKQILKALLLINLIHLLGNGANLMLPVVLRVFFTTQSSKGIIEMFHAIEALFYLFNASVNFFVYLTVNSKFKATLETLTSRIPKQ